MNRFTLINIVLVALTTLIYISTLTSAGVLPVNKVDAVNFAPRKDLWIARTSKNFRYTLNDGTQQRFRPPAYIAFGGTESDFSDNDVWASTDSLNWQMIGGRTSTVNSSNPTKGYVFHAGQAECQDFVTDSLYITGGEDGETTVQTGYVSTDGGATWKEFQMNNPRSYSNCVVDSQSRLFVMNGILNYNRQGSGNENRQPNNEVWVSSDSGDTWQQMRNASYSQRMYASIAISINQGPNDDVDIIYVIGGLTIDGDGNAQDLNDVWVSTADNRWILVNSAADFPPRIDSTLIVSRRGLLLLVGGSNKEGEASNKLWGSMDGGKNWGSLSPNNGYSGRIFPGAVFNTRGNLYIIGGEYNNQLLADYYRSNISLESNLPRTANLLDLNDAVWNHARLCLGYLPCAAPLNNTRLTFAPFTSRCHMGAILTRKDMNVTVRFANGDYPNTVFPAGSYIMAGGYNENKDNDVWISSDGINWFLLGGHSSANGTVVNSAKPDQSFKLYEGQAVCSNFDGDFIFLAGGENNVTGPTSASYTSIDAGATWTLNPTTSSFTHRSWTTCVIDSNNTIFVLGGIINYDNTGGADGDKRTPTNDVWRSHDFGKTWTIVDSEAVFTPRGAQAMAMAYKQGETADVDVIYMAGGITDYQTNDVLNDVWVSSDSGMNWIQATDAAPWVKRADPSMTVSHAGVLIVSGGRTNDAGYYVFNDIWVSFNGGVDWFLIEESTFTPRRYHGMFTDLNGQLVVIGGQVRGRNNPEAYIRDVYRTKVGNFDKPDSIRRLLNRADRNTVLQTFNPECSGYLVYLGQRCPGYLDDPPADNNDGGLSSGAIAAIAILIIIVVLGICGWSFYSIRVYGEFRIPFINKPCNCCNNALRGDQLADDGFELHKGTDRLKKNLNSGSLQYRLIDDE